jgi:hypothetical protein
MMSETMTAEIARRMARKRPSCCFDFAIIPSVRIFS